MSIEKCIYEINDVARGAVSTEDLVANISPILLIGYYSVNGDYPNVSLDEIINSVEAKETTLKQLEIISENEELIKEAISYLSDIKLSSKDISKIAVILKSSLFDKEQYREAFEYMLESVMEISSKISGMECTPSFINKLAVEIIEPKCGEFYDGTFGMGGDAILAYDYAKSYGNTLDIFGQEINKRAYSIACLRLFINGIETADVKNGDVLINPLFKENENTIKRFDSIIMNPPFSMSWKGRENEILNDKFSRFIYGKPSVSSADWLFISSILKSLKDDGKAIVITPLGTLFRFGAEGELRKRVIGLDYIETIIELTGGLFSYTSIPCALIVFNKNKSNNMKNKIQFINATNIYESVRRGKKILNDENITTILDIYRNKKVVEDISEIVDLSDLDNSILSPSKYVIQTQFESSAYGKVKIHLENLKDTKKLEDVGELYRGINVTSKNIQDPNGNYKIINLADIKNGELDVDSLPSYLIENNARVEAYKVKAGDIIISNKGATKICIIPEHEGDILISQNFIGVRVKSSYNPQYIKEFLESPIGEYLIESRKTGTAVAMINPKDLKEVPIVDMVLQDQDKIMSKYNEEEQELQRKMNEIRKSMDELKFKLYKDMNLEDTFKIM